MPIKLYISVSLCS